MGSKKYKGKPCAYCITAESKTADHVIAREFFFEEDRNNLPQVPACIVCNGNKSALEHYVTASLMAGSNHVEGDRYRREKVRPRLEKHLKLQQEIGLNRPAKLVEVNSLIRPMHPLKVDASKITALMNYIVKGLYCFHFGTPLSNEYYAEAQMMHPGREPMFVAATAKFFPYFSKKISMNLGRGAFIYGAQQSPYFNNFTIWQMQWHGGIALHGANTPPEGITRWWGITRPTQATVLAAKAKILLGEK